MLKKGIAAAALLAMTGAPLSAYAANAVLGRTAAPAAATSRDDGKSNVVLYAMIAGAIVTGILIADQNDKDYQSSP